MPTDDHRLGAASSDLDSIIASVVYCALRRSSRRAFIMVEPGIDDEVLLDGNFNFRVVGWLVRRELERRRLLAK
jgi:hypothetical protein